jgi:chromosome segregation ATPase
MHLATRRNNPEKPMTEAAFAAPFEKLHAKMDAGFAEVGRRFDRVEGDVRVMRQEIGELRQDVAEIKQGVTVLRQDVAVLKEDMSRVKDAATQHTRELSALRTSVTTKVDRDELETTVERIVARNTSG